MDETAVRLRGLAADFERLIRVYEDKVSARETVIARLEYAFDDRDLAETFYDFVFLGQAGGAELLSRVRSLIDAAKRIEGFALEAAEDERDVQIAHDRIFELDTHPEAALRGTALEDKLEAWLSE